MQHRPRLSRKLPWLYETLYRAYGPQHWWPADSPFEVMVGAILTQNTSWRNVERAIAMVREKGLMHPGRLARVRTDRLARLIKPSGYHNLKARRLINFLYYLRDSYKLKPSAMRGQKTSTLRDELLAVNGIGEETADSILLYACNRTVFVVDAYTQRILSRHNIVPRGASYSHTQHIIIKNIPKDRKVYNEFHALLVRHGKEACKNRPICEACPIKKGCGWKT